MQFCTAPSSAARVTPPVRIQHCRCTAIRSCREAAPAAREQQLAILPPAPPRSASLLDRLGNIVLAGALSAALNSALVLPGCLEAQAQTVDFDQPVVDLARVVPTGRLEAMQQQLQHLESETGWRVRMLTHYGPSSEPSVEEIRAGWSVDDKTIVIFVDPTSPNIMNFKFGRGVREVLRPQFFTELQGRFGNMFYVREQGESAAVVGMMDALTGCLAKGGCFAVPGLTADHYFFTLAVSLAGGVIAGSAARLDPQGLVQRRGVWVLLFAPLWATLFINFGLGPVVSRTSDLLPVLGNVAAFGVAAAAVGYQHKVAEAAGLTMDEPDA